MDQGIWHEEYCGGDTKVREVSSVFLSYISQQHQSLTFDSLFREIGQKCPQELAREASGMKGYAAFLTELTEQTPAIVLANMSVLLHHLDGEVVSQKLYFP